MIKSAPGHTLSHQVLFVDSEGSDPVMLGGALDHLSQNCSLERAPIFKLDECQTLESMDLIEDWLLGRNARVWIERNFVADALLNKFPASCEWVARPGSQWTRRHLGQ